MPTINSIDLTKKLIESNGIYLDDPQVKEISTYINQWGKRTYHLAYSHNDLIALVNSPYCEKIQKLWNCLTGISPLGKLFLEDKLDK